MSLPIASEKSGIDWSGIEGNETDGIEGIAGMMSRADFVMLSIRLLRREAVLNANMTTRPINRVFICCTTPLCRSFYLRFGIDRKARLARPETI